MYRIIFMKYNTEKNNNNITNYLMRLLKIIFANF